jgi:hypothetical protein
MAEKRKPGFQKGVSGNPKGKPKGARHKVTMAVEALFDNEAEVLSRKAIELAKEGDLTALRLCLDRICPPKKERSIYFDAPDLKTPADALAVIAAIARGLADGELTPGEAVTAASVTSHFVKAVEATTLEERIGRLEAAIAASAANGGKP